MTRPFGFAVFNSHCEDLGRTIKPLSPRCCSSRLLVWSNHFEFEARVAWSIETTLSTAHS